MQLSLVDKSLLLAAYFRGNTPDQDRWRSCTDQVLILSLFYTGVITAEDCQSRFANRGCIPGLYDEDGELRPQIETRHLTLIKLLRDHPKLIEGGGDFETPAYPTFTACRLTDNGLAIIPEVIDLFPQKPDFPNWPDRRANSDVA